MRTRELIDRARAEAAGTSDAAKAARLCAEEAEDRYARREDAEARAWARRSLAFSLGEERARKLAA